MPNDDEDPFSLDFTKLPTAAEPEPEPPPPPRKAEAAKPAAKAAEPPAPAKPTKPVANAEKSAPKPAPAAPKAGGAPSAFASFNAPLELLDPTAAAAAAPAPETPTPEAKPTAKPQPAAKAAVPLAAPPAAAAVAPSAIPAGPAALQEVARLHAAGKTQEASTVLEAALRAGKLGAATELGWGMMFDVLQLLNRRQAFDNLADAYTKRFEKSAPAWLELNGGNSGLETGGAAYVALSGTLSAASAAALKKLVGIAASNPVVRLGVLKVTDADNDGCRLLLEALQAIKKNGGECLLSGVDEFATMLAGKVEMMKRERQETWLLVLDLYQRAGNQAAFEDTAVGYAVTFEVSPPSWESLAPKAAASKPATTARDPFALEGELLVGMGAIPALASAAAKLQEQRRDDVAIDMDRLIRLDEGSALALHDALAPLQAKGLHIRIHGANLLVAVLLQMAGIDKIAGIETRRR